MVLGFDLHPAAVHSPLHPTSNPCSEILNLRFPDGPDIAEVFLCRLWKMPDILFRENGPIGDPGESLFCFGPVPVLIALRGERSSAHEGPGAE
jgi:hypothetical protein